MSSVSDQSTIKYFRSSRSMIRQFVAKRTLHSSAIIGLVFAIYTISKASSFIKAYPTEVARQKLAESLGSNIGIEALLGVAHHIDTIAGYATWNFLCIIAASGAVWAFLLTTKTLRGEEDLGRWEFMLAGQTTARRAAANALAGLASGLIVIYGFLAIAIVYIGHLNGANFTTSASLFFALALVAGAAEFVAVGALASQLMPVRSRATGLATGVFGLFFLLRMIADTTNAHWLLNVTPLGWIERLQPMYGSKPLWLIPIGAFIFLLVGLSIFFAGRRDLGEGIFADKDTAKSHTWSLKTPLRASMRLTRTVSLSWLLVVLLDSFLYGLLAKGVVTALGQSGKAHNALNKVVAHLQTNYISIFMGIIFFLIMLMAMFYVANAVGRIRDDEAQGYIDNFLVRPVSRNKWLFGRCLIILVVLILMGLVSGIAAWAGEASQHGGVAFHSLIIAGLNAIVPAVFTLGIGVFFFGFLPRLTSWLTYGSIAWAFLVSTLSTGLNLNHWFLDISILHQVNFVPAVSANWSTNAAVIVVGAFLGLVGARWFNSRDIQPE